MNGWDSNLNLSDFEPALKAAGWPRHVYGKTEAEAALGSPSALMAAIATVAYTN